MVAMQFVPCSYFEIIYFVISALLIKSTTQKDFSAQCKLNVQENRELKFLWVIFGSLQTFFSSVVSCINFLVAVIISSVSAKSGCSSSISALCSASHN